MKARSPQISLRLDAAPPDPAVRWHDGARLSFLGGHLMLSIVTDRKAAVREGEILHLPLPPKATPRQIQDGVESWLRQEAALLIDASVKRQSPGGVTPRWGLSFAARGGWVQIHADGSLRFNWRLIEQPVQVIEQVVGRAIAALPSPSAPRDLWEMWPA